MSDLFSLAAKAVPAEILLRDEPLSKHTSFRIGGPCPVMALPENETQMIKLLNIFRESGEPPLIIGRGTNLLITDKPLSRAVIKISDGFGRISLAENGSIIAESGASLSRLARFAMETGLSGLEFAHGIPGSLGGGCAMNAGAYGGELRDVIVSVRAMTVTRDARTNTALPEIITLAASDCDFSYRHSVFSDSSMIILGCELRLTPADPAEISDKMQTLAKRRRESQPLELPSAGSAFKRPKNAYAAELIERCGLKGYAIGGAMVNEKHAGFIVNTGGASFGDVQSLLNRVAGVVYQETGIRLTPEVKIIEG